jgi:uncharacterized protein YgfB (UPF0149 family)
MVNKRGRKRKNEMYFGPEEELAVNQYLASTDDAERNLIYNQWLRDPLNKMIESIIRRYKLYRKGETFEDLHSDTLSFLMTKAHKFESSRGKKAYSYYGTICKHYILGLLIKDKKYTKNTASYEDISSELEERQELSYTIDEDEVTMEAFFKTLTKSIREELNDENFAPKKKLNENERKVGQALIEILENWETAFDSMNGGPKYNKNSVLETLRNYTNLSTKDIRLAMRRFKELYKLLKRHDL